MRFVPLFVVAVSLGMLLSTGPQSFAADKRADDLAALKAEVAELKARVAHAESFASKVAGYRPLPPTTVNFRAETSKPAATPVAPSADVAVCVQTLNGKVIGEWTEPASIVRAAHGFTATTHAHEIVWAGKGSADLTDCAACQGSKAFVHPTATRMPATIQQCPNGQCPNARR